MQLPVPAQQEATEALACSSRQLYCLMASLVALEHVAVGDEGHPGNEGGTDGGGALA